MKKFLTILLCIALLLGSINTSGMQVFASEAELITEVTANLEDNEETTDGFDIEESHITINRIYLCVGKSIELENTQGYKIKWYVDDEFVSEDNYAPTEKDYESWIKAEAYGDNDELVCEDSVYFSKLPVVYIDTEDGQAITDKATYKDASMFIQNNEQVDRAVYDNSIQIKGRGNSTWRWSKKPYKIKLEKKTDFYGMGKNKHWVLIANYLDESLVRNTVAYNLSKELGIVNMETVWVDVILNGEYAGNYQLCEHIRVGDSRVDIADWKSEAEDIAAAIYKAEKSNGMPKEASSELEDLMEENLSWISSGKVEYSGTEYDISAYVSDWNKDITGGYIFEMSNEYDEVSKFQTSHGLKVMLNSPEFLYTNTEMMEYVKKYWQAFEDAYFAEDGYADYNGETVHYSELADFDSMVGYWLTMEIMGNIDAFSKSRFAYKDRGGKIILGPAWDFDWGCGSSILTEEEKLADGWKVTLRENNQNFFAEFVDDPYFIQKASEKYWSIRPYLESLISDGGVLDEDYAYLYESGMANSAKWYYQRGFETDFQMFKEYMAKRIAWLDIQFGTEESIIESLGKYSSSDKFQIIQTNTIKDETSAHAAAQGFLMENGLILKVNILSEDISEFRVFVNGLKYKSVILTEADKNSVEIAIPADALIEKSKGKNVITIQSVGVDGEYSGSNFTTVIKSNFVKGTPYIVSDDDELSYSVDVPHVVINQVYGGANKASYASHSFIEIYNPTDEEVDLSTWSVQYRSSASDQTSSEAWKVHKLSGTVKAHHSYLIRCGSVKDPVEGAVAINAYDEVWEQPLHNKGLTVVLLASQTQIDASSVVFDNGTKQPVVAGYVDLFAVSGNDRLETQKALYYETAVSDVQSKKKTIRRVAFEDTDNNSIEGDFEAVDYSFANPDYLAWISPRCGADGAWDENTNIRPTFTVTYESNGGSAIEEESYPLGMSVCEPQPPVREEHVFAGWYRDADLTIGYDFSDLPTENITLYAKWIHTITYKTGMPYREENGTYRYDVETPHVVINQVYGGVDEASYASHSFIELYNPTDEEVDLSTWSVQYRSSTSDQTSSEAWKVHKLSGTIKAHHSYLIRCGSVKDPVEGAVAINAYDEVWEQPLHNKGLTVVLLASRIQIDASSVVFDNVSEQPVVAGYVDLFAVSGNDRLETQKALYYETAVSDVQSKKKTIRRVAFADTDNNSIEGDFEIIDYSFANPDYLAWISPRCSADGAWDENTNIRPTFTVTYESNGGSAVEEEIYQMGTPVCEPQPPVRAEHAFEGWYRDADLTSRYDFSDLPTENITLYAKWIHIEKKAVAISGIVIQDGIYTGREIAYSGTPVVTLQQDESIAVPDVPLTYSYRGIRADQSDYFSDKAPVDAGEYILTVAVSEEDERYTGSSEYAFEIMPKVLQLTAQDKTIAVGDSLPESYDYSLEGLIEGDELTGEPSFLCEVADTSEAGTYAIEPYGACAGMNYEIVYNSGKLTIAEKIPGIGASDNELVIRKIPDQIYTGSAIKPSVEVCSTAGTLLKAGKDYTVKYFNNVSADTAAEASQGGTNPTGEEGVEGFTKELAYVRIVGKGNYQGTVYQNFHINRAAIADAHKNPADGFTLKYRDQLARSDSRAQKSVTSLKYKKSMRAGTDYMVKLTALTAYSENDALISGEVVGQSKDQTIPAIPKGYHGSFLLTIEGIGNYKGTIEKTIYIADKNSIMKNAVITLGKNQKSVPYRQGEAVTLTPGYYDVQTKEYYAVDAAGVLNPEAEKNCDNLFTVKLGNKYLIYGEDYTVTYTGNSAAGNATMTIEGIQEKGYCGSKSVIFRITGTPFTAKNISVDSATFHTKLPYTGKSLTQDQVFLKDMTADGKALVCGTDYTISYRNNCKRGTAAMIFTAEPASGYIGSFTKTFQITKAPLETDMVTVTDPSKDCIVSENGSITLTGEVAYAKGGARPSERIQLVNQEGLVLREGTDYTISYTDNKAMTTKDTVKRPCMVIKGKGDYSGILKVAFEITAASMEDNENLTFTAAQMVYNPKRGDSGYQYRPKVRITDGKQVLSATKDYQIYYGNCRQDEVKRYLDILKAGNATEEELAAKRPYALITARAGSGYTTERGVVIPLTVYETRLTGQNIYVVISEDPKQTTYTGSQLRPEIAVYYGDAAGIRAAKKAKETDAAVLTDETGKYKLCRLQQREGNEMDGASDLVVGDYTLTYGTNVTAGRNKGSVVISGEGRYGGSVKVRFSIGSKSIYSGKG